MVRKLVTLNVTGMFVPKFAAPAARMTGMTQNGWLQKFQLPRKSCHCTGCCVILFYNGFTWIYHIYICIFYIYIYLFVLELPHFGYWWELLFFMFEATGKTDEPLDPHWQMVTLWKIKHDKRGKGKSIMSSCLSSENLHFYGMFDCHVWLPEGIADAWLMTVIKWCYNPPIVSSSWGFVWKHGIQKPLE